MRKFWSNIYIRNAIILFGGTIYTSLFFLCAYLGYEKICMSIGLFTLLAFMYAILLAFDPEG